MNEEIAGISYHIKQMKKHFERARLCSRMIQILSDLKVGQKWTFLDKEIVEITITRINLDGDDGGWWMHRVEYDQNGSTGRLDIGTFLVRLREKVADVPENKE
ncbi:MAG: hypothetical protein UT24_C0022G0022 [Candidatus Woesebacteria bacterium GW2011_GWB1_39_12]|uniref:Uncharacterized protein n=1 Tax=Candidatus Woesebacteria bacterium GW2011_GWB1_39_12 TaxID=1618574 RepID=A0A0G0QDW5_9BACT|nr:MAG: hypothetical protein UT24_C0022G0022 [Candidatus Woesebacteria bacterium GW2011_GWB1_39_12]